ncbi:MAG TPA: alpha/beta hydrolase [Candidatus Binataceae bacterium]
MPFDKFVTANGLKLHYLDSGSEGLPWLVCVHGLSGNAHNFDALANDLKSKFHVLSVDVRGRGDSQWGPPTEYLPQNYVSDLVAMIDALHISRATLIGTSMGGIISLMCAGGWPDRIERLVLNDIGPEIDPAGAARIGSYVGEAPDRFENIDNVAAYYRKNYPPMAHMAEAELRDAVRWSVKPAPDQGLMWKMDPAVRRPIRGGTSAQRFDLWVPYARIECPILIVRGAESDILARATADRMCNVHHAAKVVEVPGVGHAPSLIEPISLSAIKDFLGA